MTSDSLHGFYSHDADAVRAALVRLASTDEPARARVVTNADVPRTSRHRAHPTGLWSEVFFGPRDQRDAGAWAVFELPVVVLHPALAGAVAELLGVSAREVAAVLEQRAWIEAGKVRFPPGHPGPAAPLETVIDGWPPPEFPVVQELWCRVERELAAQVGGGELPSTEVEASLAARLAEWRRARGIDAETVAVDDGAWKERAEEATGAAALARAVEAAVAASPGGRGSAEAAASLFVRWVPVPPVTDRPLEERRGGHFAAGPRSRALGELLGHAVRTRRLIELGAPPIILRNEQAMLQAALDAAFGALVEGREPRCETDAGPILAAPPPTGPTWPIPERWSELVTVAGLAFAAPGRALLDFPTATFEVDLRSGVLLRRFRSAGLRLAAVKDHLVIFGHSDQWQFSVYDLRRGAFEEGPLSDTLPFAFGEAHEVAYVVDLRTRRIHRLREVADYPTRLVLAPTCDAFYATDKEGSGGVYHCDGQLEFTVEEGVSHQCSTLLRPDGRLEAGSESELWELENSFSSALHAFAFCPARERWRVVCEGGLLDGLDLSFRLPGRIEAASFDAAAGELLIALGDQLWWLSLDPPTLQAVFELQPLHPLFLGSRGGRARPRARTLAAVLCRHGTLADLEGVELAEVAGLNAASTFDEPRPLGRTRARRVLALASEVVAPECLPCVGPRRS